MRCKRIQEMLIQFEDVVLPAFVSDHLKQCPDCRLFQERNARVRQLLAIKQYERPSPGVEERIAADVVRAVRAAPPSESAESPWSAFAWLLRSPAPAMSFAVAALMIALVTMQIMNMPELQPAEQPAAGVANVGTQPSATTPTPMLAREEAPPVLQVVSNRGAGRVEYGPGPSVPVSFDY